MKQSIIILIGISGSGKSTWASNFIQKNPEYISVSRDAIRMQITSSKKRWLEKGLEMLVTKMQDELINTALNDGFSVIIDNTHLDKKYIQEVINKYNHRASIKSVTFSIPLDIAKERVQQRDNVDVSYIDRQFNQFQKLTANGDDKVNIERQSMEYSLLDPKGVVICDLDGTLSLYDKRKSSYDRDFENDSPNEPLVAILRQLSISYDEATDYFCFGGNEIVFFSGRDSKFEDQTRQFLEEHLEGIDFDLHMRKHGDTRRDSVVKMEMFNKYIKEPQKMVCCVFDDRLQVIEEVWNKLGIPVFNVNQNLHRF